MYLNLAGGGERGFEDRVIDLLLVDLQTHILFWHKIIDTKRRSRCLRRSHLIRDDYVSKFMLRCFCY